MIPGIILSALGVVLLSLGIYALFKDQALGNLYPVPRQRMPLRFWTSVAIDFVGGATCLAIGIAYFLSGQG